ncbi:glycosyltransferase family protein [Psychrobacter celer]|uniref:glycosyltransferase family protein n=1 Tax=Psychrobacter celer TaxID=306572 RepID=UPI003FD3F8F2
MKKIALIMPHHAYAPEVLALKDYIDLKGEFKADILSLEEFIEVQSNYELVYIEMGFIALWNFKIKIPQIHSYATSSTGKHKHLKNQIKKYLSKKPVLRTFLDKGVQNRMNFKDNTPFLYRDMGVDNAFFQKPNEFPEYDILYCGSISGRNGLIESLLSIPNTYTIAIVGRTTESERKLLKADNITLMGEVSRKNLPQIYKNARFGFNYTPDIDPYNIQTSTKVLEYLASGLYVISNRYKWVDTFFEDISYQPIWLNSDGELDTLSLINYKEEFLLPIERYSWDSIISCSGLYEFLRDFLYEGN